MDGTATPAETKEPYQVTAGEEIAHAITHGIGALLAIVGFLALLRAPTTPAPLHVLACAIYGASLFLLYSASTVFHAMPPRFRRAKLLLQRCDHAAIYVLIAGTYTPFTLIALADPLSSRMFVVVWALASFGLLLTIRSLWGHRHHEHERRYERRSLVLYLAMGWLGVFALNPIIEALPKSSLALLVGGGISYTFGVVFYVRERKWDHSIWHGFVLGGSVMHYFAILLML